VKAGHASAPHTMEVHAAEGDIAPWDLDSRLRLVKGRHPRLEAPLKVTGRAKYTYDIGLPGMLWARMVRAPLPAAEIVAIDTSQAQALPGVKAVWATESRKVRFQGQDIAAVAAVSPEVAEDAARLIAVTYDDRPYVTDLKKAMEDGAPLVYEAAELPDGADDDLKKTKRSGNVVGPRARRNGLRGDVDAGLAAADARIEATYEVPVHTHVPLETHGVVARWEGDQLTIWASTQGVGTVQEGMAEYLGIDRKNVTVITEHMGGGFGSKLHPSAEGSAFAGVCCKLAKMAGAPVKLMLHRQEQHACAGNAPSALMTVRLGGKKDGTLTAVHFRSYGSAGVADGAGTGGPASALYGGCPNLKIEEYDVFTNAGPAAPLRAPGHPQGAFGLESAMDELAQALGMDPLELRRKNETSPVRRIQYEAGAKAIGWERRNATPGSGRGAGGPLRGIGMANGNWYVFARGAGVFAEVKIHRDGGVELFQGSQDIGTGLRTALAMVVAEELGITPREVTVRIGDTRYPAGVSSGGSNTTNSVAPAVRLAAHDAMEKLKAAAGLAEIKSLKQAALRMPGEMVVGSAERKKQYETYRSDLAGTQFVEVEVDADTGNVRVVKVVAVNDCGFPINALTAESQVIGAMIQGVSWALFENRVIDRNVGTQVNPNIESYKVLGARDMFEAVPILTEIANAGNNTSAAGLGEPCLVPTLAAVANAVFNATGVRVRELPITPDKVLAGLRRRT